MRRVRLVIADRRPIVLQGFSSLFAAQTDFEVVASCLDGASCLEALRKLTPDVALVEDGFPDVTARDMLAAVRAERLPARLVFYTASVARGELAAAIAAGACNAISMRERPERVMQSLRLVAARHDQARAGHEENGAFAENALTMLTDPEREIMRLVAHGLSDQAIARQLNVSLSTIKVHLTHMFAKLEVDKRSKLRALALSQRYGALGVLAAVIFAALEDDHAASLNAAETGHVVTETFKVVAADGSAEFVTIVINRPKESADASGIMAKILTKARSAANAAAKTPITSSKLVDSTIDVSGNTFTSAASNGPRPSAGAYGAFMMVAAAVWIYVLDSIHSVAKALDFGGSPADLSASTAANGTAALATLALASKAAASPDGHDNPASPNSSVHDWSSVFGTLRADAAAFGEKIQLADANAADDTASGKDDSPQSATDADTIGAGSVTVNALAGHTADRGDVSQTSAAGASQQLEDNATPNAGDDSDHGQSQRDLHASEHGLAAPGQQAEHHATTGSGGNPHASEQGAAGAKQHGKSDAPGNDPNHGQSQRELHASEHGSAAPGQQAAHHAKSGSDGNASHDPHASEEGAAAAKQHGKNDAPSEATNHGQSQRDLHADHGTAAAGQNGAHHATPGSDANPGHDLHASEEGSAAADQHAKHHTTAESDANSGQSQHTSHAVHVSASDNPHSESSPNAEGKDHGTSQGSQAQTPAALELGDSFHFKNEIATSKAPDILEHHSGHGSASTEHDGHADQHDGLIHAEDTGLISPSLAEHNAVDHTKGAEHHLIHDLIV